MIIALDLLLVVCFFLTVLDGVRNGFFREGFTLAGVAIGLWAALVFTAPVQQRLPSFLRDVQAVGVVLFVLICILAVMALRLAGSAFAAMWEGKRPTPPSRMAGLLLGSVRGLALVLVLAGGLALLLPPGSHFLGQSRLLPFLSPGIVWGSELLPRELGERLLRRWGELPFEDRAIRPGRDPFAGVLDGHACRCGTCAPGSGDRGRSGGIATQWHFAS